MTAPWLPRPKSASGLIFDHKFYSASIPVERPDFAFGFTGFTPTTPLTVTQRLMLQAGESIELLPEQEPAVEGLLTYRGRIGADRAPRLARCLYGRT